MARRSTPEPPRPANLSAQQMKAAIPKLERRIAELQAIDASTIRERGESRFEALEQKIEDTLVQVFGADTIEYRRFHVGSLDTASFNMLHETPMHEVIEGYRRGIEQAISNLQTVIELFKENLSGFGRNAGGTRSARFRRIGYPSRN